MSVIIDPGHGGKDPGGGSNSIWEEKDKVLEISLYQYKRLKELGFEVELTRDKDIYLNSTERSRIVRNSKADICISNHINAYNGRAEGAETIHSIHSDGKLASMIIEELVTAGAKKRRVFSKESTKKKGVDWYFMHRETGNVQTVIIEYGFADNEEDAKKIQENWKEYAEAVIRAICIYANVPYVVNKGIEGVSGWAKESWLKAIRKGINDGTGAKNNVTEEQLMVFFDKLGLLD